MEHLSSRRIYVGLIVMVVLGILFAASTSLHGVFVEAAGWLERHAIGKGPLGVVLFILLGMASAMLSPFSSAPLVPSAVLAWGRWPTVLLLIGSWTLGGACAWLLGRFAGDRVRHRSGRLRAFEQRIGALPPGASFTTALALRVALPSEVGYAYGLLRYDFWRYLVITVLAEIPSALVLVFVSDALLQRRLVMVLVAAAVVVATVVIAAVVRGRWSPRGGRAPG